MLLYGPVVAPKLEYKVLHRPLRKTQEKKKKNNGVGGLHFGSHKSLVREKLLWKVLIPLQRSPRLSVEVSSALSQGRTYQCVTDHRLTASDQAKDPPRARWLPAPISRALVLVSEPKPWREGQSLQALN